MIRRLQTRLARIQGITLYMQAAQDITIGGRLSKTQYQYTLADADPGELNHWAALFLDKIKAIPGITDVTTDQENAGPLLDITVNREVASSFGILPATIDNTLDDAFGQRIVSTMYTMNNQYHVVLEVDPKFQFGPEALNNIYVNSSTGQQVPLRTLVNSGREGGAARGQSSRPVPVGDDLVQPAAGQFDWARRSPPSSRSRRSSASRPRWPPASRATPRPSSRRCRARRS